MLFGKPNFLKMLAVIAAGALATGLFLTATGKAAWATFPGQNGKIAFTGGSGTNGAPDIFVMNPDGSAQKNLTNNPAVDDSPAWSPNSNQIAFETQRDGNWEIYVMNPDGSAQKNLTNNPDSDLDPAWSPDGKQIVFSRGATSPAIWVMNADGSGQKQLTGPGFYTSPRWSPDGNHIVFVCTDDICMMNADGTGISDLTNSPGIIDDAPDWSPNGSQIVFSSRRDDPSGEIYVMNADGSSVQRLTNNSAGERDAKWSPDGKKIVFSSTRDGSDDIFMMNPDGTGQTNITKTPNQSEIRADWGSALTPQDQTQNLKNEVTSLNLPPGTSTSLQATLTDALNAINAGNKASACSSLGDFVSQVKAQSGKKISTSDANTLIADAQQIMTALGC